MQPNNVTSWEDFRARKAPAPEQTEAVLEQQLADSIEKAKREKTPSKRKPAAVPEPPATLADVLKQAVSLAMARGRTPRETAVREETLLEILIDAMRRAQ